MPKGDSLTPSDVGAIKWHLHQGMKRRDIAREFGVVTETIAKIARGDTWPSIPMLRPGELSSTEKLDAEFLAPPEGMAERLIQASHERFDLDSTSQECKGCSLSWPLDPNGVHRKFGVEQKCTKLKKRYDQS